MLFLVTLALFLQQPGQPRMETDIERAHRIWRQMQIAGDRAAYDAITERQGQAIQRRSCVESLDRQDVALHMLHDAGSAVKPDIIHDVANAPRMKALDKATRDAERAVKAVRRSCFAR